MKTITLASSTIYYNLYTLTTYTQGTTVVIHNNTSDVIFLAHSSTQPSPTTSLREFVGPGEAVIAHANGLPIWVMGTTGPILVQPCTERLILPITGADLPHDLYTAPKELYRRVKVDPGQTSFHDGREFRTFYEFSIPAATSVYIQANVAVDTILYDVSVVLDAGSLRLTSYAGATGVGTFSTDLPVLAKNNMSIRSTPIYTPQNTVRTGGTGVTGGVIIDTIRVVAANATAQQTSVGSKAFDQRGVGVGTYYWRLENFGSGAATGIFSGWWAEILNLGV